MAVQVSYPGVYIQERPSGARAIAAVPTSIAAFVGMIGRGPLNTPTRVPDLTAFERIFGVESSGGDMGRAVEAFFTNGGGMCFVTRIADGAEPATIEIEDEAGNKSLRLTARNAGEDGNSIRAEVGYRSLSRFDLRLYRRTTAPNGALEEADAELFTDLSMDRNAARFVETIVNAESELALARTIYDEADRSDESVSIAGVIFPSSNDADVVTALQARFPGDAGQFMVSVDSGRPLTVRIDAPAVGSTAEAFATSVQTAIRAALLDEGIRDDATVEFLPEADSITGGRFLRIAWPATPAGDGGPVSISPAPAEDIARAFHLGEASGGIEIDRHAAVRPAPTGAVSRLHVDIGDHDLSRLIAFADTRQDQFGDFELIDSSGDTPPPHSGPVFAPATVDRMFVGDRFTPVGGDTAIGAFVNVEENLEALAGAVERGSNRRWDASVAGLRISLTPGFGGSNTGLDARLTTNGDTDIGTADAIFEGDAAEPTAYNVAAYSLGRTGGVANAGPYQDDATAGSNGGIPTLADYRAAFSRIEREVDLFNLMVLPRADDGDSRQTDEDRATLWGEASAFCAAQRAFLLVDPPTEWDTPDAAGGGAQVLRTGVETRNAAVFWPRLSLGGDRTLDPAGAIAGLMARIDGNRGVWKAPAGLEATIIGVRGVETPMSDADNGVLNPLAINALRAFPAGVVAWGSRTLVGFNDSGNIDDKYIPVRRTMLMIEESLYRGLHFAVFEPNDEPLWAQIRLAAGSFMQGLFRQQAFAGAKASDAYFVQCDETTTSETDKNLGIVNVIVGFAPLKPAEFVVVTISQIAGQTQA